MSLAGVLSSLSPSLISPSPPYLPLPLTDLLLVKDSQNDTPVTIALKECAYFLCAYSEQNRGRLDDGTAYDDDSYTTYYPEVEELRDEVYTHGEFVPQQCITHALTSTDLLILKEEGMSV